MTALSPRGCIGSIGRFIRAIALILLNEKSVLQFIGLFLLNMIPLIVWISTFKNARLIPAEIRPPIHVNLLPLWEHVLFETPAGLIGQSVVLAGIYYAVIRSPLAIIAAFIPFILNVENYFAHGLNETKDLFAWISYGVVHFVSPYFTAVWLWFFAPPGIVGVYGWSLGFQNCAGIATHLIFPNASPWYYSDEYGLGNPPTPANYSMPGSAAGLKRVDKVLGIHLYEHAFEASPLVFGALPSLHSAFAVINFYFVARYSPKRGKFLYGAFVFWQWWATIYLMHHWRVDLITGALYSTISFLCFIPSMKRYEARHRGWSGWARLWHYDDWSGYQALKQAEFGTFVPIPMEDTTEASKTTPEPKAQ